MTPEPDTPDTLDAVIARIEADIALWQSTDDPRFVDDLKKLIAALRYLRSIPPSGGPA